MKIKLIGTYQMSIVNPPNPTPGDEIFIDHILDNVILKNDFDNNRIEGYCDFFNNQKDCTYFSIQDHVRRMGNSLDYIHKLTENQIELLNSLEQGDVIVLEGDIYVHTPAHLIVHSYSKIENIEKFDDNEAAEKIRKMVSEIPLKPDIKNNKNNKNIRKISYYVSSIHPKKGKTITYFKADGKLQE